MTLRSALIAPDGQVSHPFEIDDRVCECCPTAAVRTADGVLVAYRDRSENEVRNIGLTRFDGDEWSDPYLLHDDGWQINGCPVNGPALAADGNRVAAAWFTAPNSRPRVQVAFSDDGGRQFGEPLVVDADGVAINRLSVETRAQRGREAANGRMPAATETLSNSTGPVLQCFTPSNSRGPSRLADPLRQLRVGLLRFSMSIPFLVVQLRSNSRLQR
jgi:hypothetical protein